jgi:hypothetical protein
MIGKYLVPVRDATQPTEREHGVYNCTTIVFYWVVRKYLKSCVSIDFFQGN